MPSLPIPTDRNLADKYERTICGYTVEIFVYAERYTRLFRSDKLGRHIRAEIHEFPDPKYKRYVHDRRTGNLPSLTEHKQDIEQEVEEFLMEQEELSRNVLMA